METNVSEVWHKFSEAPEELRDIFVGRQRRPGYHRGVLLTLSSGLLAVVWHEQFTGEPVSFTLLEHPTEDFAS